MNTWLRSYSADLKNVFTFPSPYKLRPRSFQNISFSDLNLQGFMTRGKDFKSMCNSDRRFQIGLLLSDTGKSTIDFWYLSLQNPFNQRITKEGRIPQRTVKDHKAPLSPKPIPKKLLRKNFL
jgi:hypothetical protein